MTHNMQTEVGIASYSFHKLLEEKMIDVYGYLESLKYRYHLQMADIWNGFIHDRGMDVEDYRKIRRAMDDRGIILANLCCDWAHPWSDSKDELEAQNRYAEEMLVCAEILGAKSVRIDLGVHEMDISEAQYDYVAGKFAQYAKRGGECGFKVGPENHWGASRKLAVQKRLFKDINLPSYGMLLHLGNWELEEGETMDGNDQAVASIAFHTHVDYQHAMRAEEVLPPLSANGYTGVFSCEHHIEINEYHAVTAQVGRIMYAVSKI